MTFALPMRTPRAEVDMHNHSHLSKDGKMPPKRLIDMAARRRITHFGICDHDVFPDPALYAHAAKMGVGLALGTEFSCDGAHIIGFNLSPCPGTRARLEGHFKALRENVQAVTIRIIEGLRAKGVDVSLDRIAAYAGKEPQKMFLLKYLADELRLFPSWAEARCYLASNGLNLCDGAGIRLPHPAEVVQTIRENGGFSIWAHPFFTAEARRVRTLGELIDAGLDAVEAVYPYQENGYRGAEPNIVLQARTLALIKHAKLAVTGGSDSHYPVKTNADLRPIMPGDFGITAQEIESFSHIFH